MERPPVRTRSLAPVPHWPCAAAVPPSARGCASPRALAGRPRCLGSVLSSPGPSCGELAAGMAGEPRDRGACDASQQGSGVLKLPSRVRFEVGDRGHPGDAETAGFGGGDADPAGSQQDRLTQYGGTGRDFGRSLTGERLGVDVPFAGDDEVSRAKRNVEADQVKEEGGAAADARPEEGNGARRHAACGTSTGHARDVHRGFGAKEACQMAEASVEIEYVLVGGSLLPSEPVGRTVRAGERGGDVGCYDQAGFAQARIES